MEQRLKDYISILNLGNQIKIPADKITIEEAEYFHQHGLDIIVSQDKKTVKIELSK